MLDNNDLPSALTAVAQQLSENAQTRISVATLGPSRRLPQDLEHQLLRIAQEAVTNAIRHAKSRVIQIELTFHPQAAQLLVRDDGCGFEPRLPEAGKPGHFGLVGMRERARALGGKLVIESHPGSGTMVKVNVPTPLNLPSL